MPLGHQGGACLTWLLLPSQMVADHVWRKAFATILGPKIAHHPSSLRPEQPQMGEATHAFRPSEWIRNDLKMAQMCIGYHHPGGSGIILGPKPAQTKPNGRNTCNWAIKKGQNEPTCRMCTVHRPQAIPWAKNWPFHALATCDRKCTGTAHVKKYNLGYMGPRPPPRLHNHFR